MGFPACIVADAGHRNGARIRDFGAFGDPDSPHRGSGRMRPALGQTQRQVANAACRQFLAAPAVEPRLLDRLARPPARKPQRVVEVTEAVTVAAGRFRFTQAFQGLEVILDAGTVIAYDGALPIRTPYDQCVLIMPRRLAPGFTAVRSDGSSHDRLDDPRGDRRGRPAIVALVHMLDAEEAKAGTTLTSDILVNGFGASPRFRVLLAEPVTACSATCCFPTAMTPSTRRVACTSMTCTSCPRRAARASGGR